MDQFVGSLSWFKKPVSHSLRKSVHELIDIFKCVVEVRRDAKPVAARCGNDVSLLKVRVERHWAQTTRVSYADDL